MAVETIDNFAETIAKLLKTDRWVFLVCDGDMGEGKSCFTTKLAKAIAKKTKTKFSYTNNMTFSRKEMKAWIDGNAKLKIKRKKQYSVILADELISMFFKRNWFDSEQIDGIELLNKCRDRHLAILGNLPSYWDLDSAIFPISTFRVHIYERGRAWVFQKDRNPFATDKWHRLANEKVFRKKKNPYGCHGFLCEIHFDNWSKEEKEHYYRIRNKKRIKTEGQRAKEERYKDVKQQRDELIRLAFELDPKLKNKDVHNLIPSLGVEAIRLIRKRER